MDFPSSWRPELRWRRSTDDTKEDLFLICSSEVLSTPHAGWFFLARLQPENHEPRINSRRLGKSYPTARSSDADTGAAGDQAFSFIGGGAFTHHAGELQARAVGANTVISGDVDGNGVADFQIRLNGSVALQATDFVL